MCAFSNNPVEAETGRALRAANIIVVFYCGSPIGCAASGHVDARRASIEYIIAHINGAVGEAAIATAGAYFVHVIL